MKTTFQQESETFFAFAGSVSRTHPEDYSALTRGYVTPQLASWEAKNVVLGGEYPSLHMSRTQKLVIKGTQSLEKFRNKIPARVDIWFGKVTESVNSDSLLSVKRKRLITAYLEAVATRATIERSQTVAMSFESFRSFYKQAEGKSVSGQSFINILIYLESLDLVSVTQRGIYRDHSGSTMIKLELPATKYITTDNVISEKLESAYEAMISDEKDRKTELMMRTGERRGLALARYRLRQW